MPLTQLISQKLLEAAQFDRLEDRVATLLQSVPLDEETQADLMCIAACFEHYRDTLAMDCDIVKAFHGNGQAAQRFIEWLAEEQVHLATLLSRSAYSPDFGKSV